MGVVLGILRKPPLSYKEFCNRKGIDMKVVVGDNTYDGDKIPVMVILSNEDKDNIVNMEKHAACYCSYPANRSKANIEKWMATHNTGH